MSPTKEAPKISDSKLKSTILSIIKNSYSTKFEEKSAAPVSNGVAGPVGMYSIVSRILESSPKTAFLALLDLTALLSLTLSIMNLLPFPALDGGRIIFVIYEIILRKKPNPKVEANIHKIGMLLLLTLIVLITIKDIRTFF